MDVLGGGEEGREGGGGQKGRATAASTGAPRRRRVRTRPALKGHNYHSDLITISGGGAGPEGIQLPL